ncbi:MAG: DUF1674 domain-containing protein [Gammaproteobacteria bacterium]
MPPDTEVNDGASPAADPAVGIWRPAAASEAAPSNAGAVAKEVGGRKDGTEPTRFGDWEKAGRCIDF